MPAGAARHRARAPMVHTQYQYSVTELTLHLILVNWWYHGLHVMRMSGGCYDPRLMAGCRLLPTWFLLQPFRFVFSAQTPPICAETCNWRTGLPTPIAKRQPNRTRFQQMSGSHPSSSIEMPFSSSTTSRMSSPTSSARMSMYMGLPQLSK
jgi:hypothetical protein